MTTKVLRDISVYKKWYPTDNADYVYGRLTNSLVEFDTQLAQVNTVYSDRGSLLAELQTVPRTLRVDDSTRISGVNVDEIVLRPVPLGFSLVGDYAPYLQRSAARRYQQGLTRNSLIVSQGTLMSNLSFWKAVAIPYYNLYPSLQTALEMVEDYFRSVPINRDFAVTEDLKLLYRSYRSPVGKLNIEDRSCTLESQYGFLKETAEESELFTNVSEAAQHA